ncbi:MAG: phospholipase D-like domain-containing protein, partial [bacterium]|nr:phospholipase D-like domain-containing protein [bacterium]
MSSKFITNQNELLSDVIHDILPSADKLHFLVGYFYFSGFEQLYQNLIDKQMRILIGMDVERTILNKIKEFEIIQEVNFSRGQIKQNYFNSLVTLFNDTDFFDTEKKQAAFKLFLAKIRDGSLEIKKTEQPNHAKLYLFEKKPEHSEGGRYPGALITGSSNLSLSGLTARNEV